MLDEKGTQAGGKAARTRDENQLCRRRPKILRNLPHAWRNLTSHIWWPFTSSRFVSFQLVYNQSPFVYLTFP